MSVMVSVYEGGSVITLDQVESRGLAHRVGYWLPVAGFLHVPGEGVSGAYVTGRGGKSAAEPELDTVYTSYHYGYSLPAVRGGGVPHSGLCH